ncbi:MAG: hypothetical protein WD716_11735 [Fimbriimonadaceae bacterium]
MLTLVLALLLGQPNPDAQTYRILFLGNSHTASNDLPGMVSGLLRSAGHTVETSFVFGGFLDDLEPRQDVRDTIDGGKLTHVVLQATKMSSSHRYEYTKEPGIALVNRAKKAGARPLLFAEWPRKGWDEVDYILGQYEAIRSKAGGEIVPVCRAWAEAVKKDPSLDLWAADGNHAKPLGTYLAACAIALTIGGNKAELTYVPRGVDPKLAPGLLESVRRYLSPPTGPN